ncbi:MAG: hypothetical protein PWR16_1382 [Methanoculleus sp.]|nr:hypothetical protein [Methanoculleus sp.]
MAQNSLHPAAKQVQIVPREVFDRLPRVHRAVLLVMEQDGEVQIGPPEQGEGKSPAQQRGEP